MVKAVAGRSAGGRDKIPDRMFEDLFDSAARPEYFQLDQGIYAHLRVPAAAIRH